MTYIYIYNWGSDSRSRSKPRWPVRPTQGNGPSALDSVAQPMRPAHGWGLRHWTVSPKTGFAEIQGIREN